jgi:hypothetical protein
MDSSKARSLPLFSSPQSAKQVPLTQLSPSLLFFFRTQLSGHLLARFSIASPDNAQSSSPILCAQ